MKYQTYSLFIISFILAAAVLCQVATADILPLAAARGKFTGERFGNLRPLAAGERHVRAVLPAPPKTLTDKMLQGHIDIDNDLPDSAAREALMKLRDAGIPAAILGGAVRELILGCPKPGGEVDVLLMIDASSIKSKMGEEYEDEVDKLAREALDGFVRALARLGINVTRDQLRGGGPAIKLGGISLDFLGYVDFDGDVWGKSSYNFEAFPEFSINRAIITTQGRVLDPYKGVNDGVNNVLRLAGGAQKNISHQLILRGIRFLLQYPDMRMTPETEKIILGFFDSDAAGVYQRYTRQVEEVSKILSATDKLVDRLRRHGITQWLVKHAIAYGRRRLYRHVVRNNPPYIGYRSHEAGYLTEYERYFGIDTYSNANYSILPADDPVRKESFNEIVDGVVGFRYFSTRTEVDFSGSKTISRTDRSGIGRMVGDIYRVARHPRQATDMIRRAGLEQFLRACGINLNRVEQQANSLAQARAEMELEASILRPLAAGERNNARPYWDEFVRGIDAEDANLQAAAIDGAIKTGLVVLDIDEELRGFFQDRIVEPMKEGGYKGLDYLDGFQPEAPGEYIVINAAERPVDCPEELFSIYALVAFHLAFPSYEAVSELALGNAPGDESWFVSSGGTHGAIRLIRSLQAGLPEDRLENLVGTDSIVDVHLHPATGDARAILPSAVIDEKTGKVSEDLAVGTLYNRYWSAIVTSLGVILYRHRTDAIFDRSETERRLLEYLMNEDKGELDVVRWWNKLEDIPGLEFMFVPFRFTLSPNGAQIRLTVPQPLSENMQYISALYSGTEPIDMRVAISRDIATNRRLGKLKLLTERCAESQDARHKAQIMSQIRILMYEIASNASEAEYSRVIRTAVGLLESLEEHEMKNYPSPAEPPLSERPLEASI